MILLTYKITKNIWLSTKKGNRYMEKERKFKTIAVVSVIVAIIGLSIAFAALSQTLTINGTAKTESSTWLVVWEKISGEEFVPTGTAEVQDNYPTLSNNNTNLNLGTITLKKPGDKVTYRVNMANNGDIDAKVTGVTGVSVDNTYVSYKVSYVEDGIDITAANNRLLAANAKKLVLIEVKFKEDVTTAQYNQIPEDGITVNLNGVQIQYSQNDGSAITSDPEPEVQSYSFTLNQLTELSSYDDSDGAFMINDSEFWNLIGTDLTEDEDLSLLVEEGFYLFAVHSDSDVVLGLNDMSIRGSAPSGAEFLVMVSQQANQVAVSISDANGGIYYFGHNGNMTFQEFLSEYGNVTFTFVDTSNMNF